MASRLIAFAVLLQSIENWELRKNLWSWVTLCSEFPRLIAKLFTQGVYSALVIAQTLLAFLLLVAADLEGVRAIALLTLASISVFISIRWRGAFNGGSDSMTWIVLFFLGLASVVPNEKLSAAFLAYISIQVCLSYFISGAVKLRQISWRNGTALTAIVNVSNFEVPTALKTLTNSKTTALILSWTLIIFELSFPLALLKLEVAYFYIAGALIFHLLNFYAFGLNRFLFAWTAAYATIPATVVLLFS